MMYDEDIYIHVEIDFCARNLVAGGAEPRASDVRALHLQGRRDAWI